jgi:glycosyltransferase involved in cell wall biosynthesis
MRIVWEGPQESAHSFALCNREFCLGLLARGHDLAIVATGSRSQDGGPSGIPPAIAARLCDAPNFEADVHVRHQWPPRFDPPPSGRWVIMQPWEFGSIPAAWVRPMSTIVDEVWSYTRFVRNCYIAAGIPPSRAQVVPVGVDPDVFRPQAPPLNLGTSKRFKFLFVGGTIHRKGIDILLNAYASAFSNADDVCLVIKDIGTGSFYRGQTSGPMIDRLRATPGAPEVIYFDRTLDSAELAGLYAACDCLVHPYRGEGFGLPIAEAMACGVPGIVTGYGAALDFCNEENAYLILARVPRFAERRIGDIETIDHPWLAEPDAVVLRHLLRHVVANPDEVRNKGRAASELIRSRFTWSRAVDAIELRLKALCQQPRARLQDSDSTRGY